MQDRLKIGVSACFFYPEPGRSAFALKTLQYVEQSVPHWIMSGGGLPVMIGMRMTLLSQPALFLAVSRTA